MTILSRPTALTTTEKLWPLVTSRAPVTSLPSSSRTSPIGRRRFAEMRPRSDRRRAGVGAAAHSDSSASRNVRSDLRSSPSAGWPKRAPAEDSSRPRAALKGRRASLPCPGQGSSCPRPMPPSGLSERPLDRAPHDEMAARRGGRQCCPPSGLSKAAAVDGMSTDPAYAVRLSLIDITSNFLTQVSGLLLPSPAAQAHSSGWVDRNRG